jgi:hypothetical protein
LKSPALHSLKFSKLKRRLKLSHWQCVGILESLWLFTQANAPRGDVGKHSDEDIAAAIEWDGDASELVWNLTECGWLDACDENRLVVHDWADHAPKYLKGALHKNGQDFAKPANSTLLKHPAKQPAKQGARAPDTKPNLTKPNQTEESREPAPPASPPAAVVLTYTTIGSGPKEWQLTEPHLAELKSLYPGVDVLAECRKALAWLNANTSRRKTHRGMPAFLVRWLNKSNDGGPGSRLPACKPSPASSLPYDDYTNYVPKGQTQ